MANNSIQSPPEVSPKPTESIEVDEEIKEEETGDGVGGLSRELYKEMRAICDVLSDHRISVKGDEDYYPSVLFRRIPNKRNLPEYHTIIQEPRAISTLRQKAQTRKYTNFAEYVRDFALIVHNAHVFNRPNSGPVRDVLVLKALFEEELARLVERGLIAKEDTIFPDLGEIPEDATPEPELKTDDEEEGEEDVEGDDEDEDDDDDQDDSDEEGKGKRRRRVGRPSMAGRKRNRSAEGQKGGEVDARKRRGRPPRVDTPMEARIKAVLKSIRKFRSEAGHLKVLPFERLPDKTQNPGYYIEIKEPMAVDLIKRKVKRKKYQSLEHFMKDMELMFNNAMQYNEDESDLYKDAKELWEEAKSTAEAEKQKPDTEYLMEDGKLPLPNGILHNNELWKVGDWVHIQNPNDVTKPIVAQIYRTWQNTDGQQWVNACWYYRPEQTVHHHEKHFYPNEVVKTGQYRDHHIDEIIDRCFVMFFTRYNRGRPRGLDPTKEVYVCEARYNAEKHRLNKIKTWASCLPDEVREKDYEMDLFEAVKKIKKLPSPIKHLLKPGANETDELPSPQWGRENAPPIVGAVHAQPRDENQSPPPEPTPSPPPTPPPPPPPPRQISDMVLPKPPRPSLDGQGDIMLSNLPGRPSSTVHTNPSMTPGSAYHQTSASSLPGVGRPTPYQQTQRSYGRSGIPQTPTHAATYAQASQAASSAAHPSSYTPSSIPQSFASRVQAQSQHIQATPSYQSSTAQQTQVPQVSQRYPEVYCMSDAANSSIPLEIRQQFPCDDQGRVLWFTTPPLHHTVAPLEAISHKDGKPLAHTPKYLAAKEKRKALIEERKREAQARLSGENNNAQTTTHQPESNGGGSGNPPSPKRPKLTDDTYQPGTLVLTDQLLNASKAWYASIARGGGDGDGDGDGDDERAAAFAEYDALRAAERRKAFEDQKAYFEEKRRAEAERRERERAMEGRVFRDDWMGRV